MKKRDLQNLKARRKKLVEMLGALRAGGFPTEQTEHELERVENAIENGTYCGWVNRETWNVDLWLNGSEESLYRYFVQRIREAKTRDGRIKPGVARIIATDCLGQKTPDGDRLSRADFEELARAWNEYV